MKRMNWGCGDTIVPGWINSDRKQKPGIDISCDIRDGLPMEDDSLDYIVSVHSMPEIPYPDLVPTLRELRRVIRPGGVLRLCLPDLDKGIAAYQGGNKDYFLIPDEDARSIGAKFIVQMLWYSYSRSLFTYDFTEELLQKAEFKQVRRCAFGQTFSGLEGVADLDNREIESLFVEATK